MHVFGKNVAKEILNNPKIINKIYLYDNFNDKDILNKIKDNNIQTKLLTKHELDNIENGNHQGKTSAGTLEKVNIAMVSNLTNAIKTLKDNGFWIIGTDMEGTDYKKIDYTGKIALIIGNEGKGMSRLVAENCDFIAKIPMYGTVNSLNASVAAALVIYEAVRNK